MRTSQDHLKADTEIHGPVLEFDWRAIQIGIGSYEEGPTGLTIFRFPDSAMAAVDVRGGSLGTVNTEYLNLGYEQPIVDAVVFAGGSAYGEEAITGVATGLKDDGAYSGEWGNVALVVGAIIYDFFGRRLNEIYPDKRLAQAALQDLRSGVFPLGAQGAGRMAMQGAFFGRGVHSGQGGAFRQIDDLKVAGFVVVNSSGAITDRNGRLVRFRSNLSDSGATGGGTPSGLPKAADLLADLPARRLGQWTPRTDDHRRTGGQHTTISLVVINQKVSYAALQRLAVQVHTSMARGIQPFSTDVDGDTLFALSTQEVSHSRLSLRDLNTIAGEVMWDAILASVPEEPVFVPPPSIDLSLASLTKCTGAFRFGPKAVLRIRIDQDQLVAEPSMDFFDFSSGQSVNLKSISESDFYVPGVHRTRVSFPREDSGKIALINPGRWQQLGFREAE
ncbi:MAG TPA: P1 family peptidase [Chthoniobacterales bacterium]|nr:P1 family peptidase [Chthoniobacterales bacterium]